MFKNFLTSIKIASPYFDFSSKNLKRVVIAVGYMLLPILEVRLLHILSSRMQNDGEENTSDINFGFAISGMFVVSVTMSLHVALNSYLSNSLNNALKARNVKSC